MKSVFHSNYTRCTKMLNSYSNRYTVFIDNQSLGETLGITEFEIRQIVHAFYKKVRDDQLLGPVFAQEMTEDWDHHLIKMCNFWTTVMFAKPLYKGNPLDVHSRIGRIMPDHFDRWLALFEQTLTEVCPSQEHAQAFYQRAANMARVMSGAIGLGQAGHQTVADR